MRTSILVFCLAFCTSNSYAGPISATTATVQRNTTTVTDSDPVAALARITAPTNQTTSYIDLTGTWFTDYAGSIDINHGWSSNNNGTHQTTTVAHSLLWTYTFDQLVDGSLSADVTIARTGSNAGVNGITLSDNYGNTQTFTNSGTWTIPLIGGNTYVFTAAINNSRTGNNGLNVNTIITTGVAWIVVPEPEAAPMLLVGACFALFVLRGQRR